MSKVQKPLVSVRLMVYNNEPYIREAVESILRQKTSFKVEIVVGDDFSTDNTLDIIKSYECTENVYFNILDRPIGGEYWKDRQRLGRLYNFKNIIDNCQGKYIALLDGDDYWTDPLKLQKQVGFLENDSNYALCFHNVKVLNAGESDDMKSMLNGLSKVDFDTIDILKQWFIPTCSIVFRNSESLELPYWFTDCISGDIPLLLLLSLQGKFHFIDELCGVYRKHIAGVSNSHMGYYKAFGMVYIYQNFNVYTNYKLNKYVEKAILYELKAHLPEFKRKPNTKRVEADAIIILYLKVKSRFRKLYNFLKNN